MRLAGEGPSGQSQWFRSFSYDELMQRDKVSLDLFWLRDESLEGADALPSPDVLAARIAEDLRAALEQFAAIAADLGGEPNGDYNDGVSSDE